MREDYYKKWTGKYGMGHTRRDRIIELVEGANLRILDVGCASGALGQEMKDLGNWVGGVELADEGVNKSRERLDRIWSFDVEDKWPDELQQGNFDLIILGEILEHVFDPVSVLKKIRRTLREGGHIIITTPNFMTWTNRIRFLFGDFRYKEEGMFDFGHIRWFTYRYLKEVLENAQFKLERERHIIFPNKFSLILKRWPSLFAWQFIIKAKKN